MAADEESEPNPTLRSMSERLSGWARRVSELVSEATGRPVVPEALREPLAAIRSLRLAGDLSDALVRTHGLRTEYPTDPFVSWTAGLIYIHDLLGGGLPLKPLQETLERLGDALGPDAGHVLHAAQLLFTGEHERALDSLRRARKLDAAGADRDEALFLVHAMSALAHERCGRRPRALRSWQRARREAPTELGPGLTSLMLDHAVDLALVLGDTDEAQAWLRQIDPSAALPHVHRRWHCRLQASKGDRQGAHALLLELDDDPQREETELWVGLTVGLPRADPAAALLKVARKAVRERPDEIRLRRLWALAELQHMAPDDERSETKKAPAGGLAREIVGALTDAATSVDPALQDAHLQEAAHVALRLENFFEPLCERIEARLRHDEGTAPMELRLVATRAILRAAVGSTHPRAPADLPDPSKLQMGLDLGTAWGPDPCSPLRHPDVRQAVLASQHNLARAEFALATGNLAAVADLLVNALVEWPDLGRARVLLSGHRHAAVVPRLENLLTGATEVLASIPSTVLGISLAEAETALHRVVAARERMANPLTIAVMGEFSAGKSTFVNALLGQEIAPVGVLPTTTTINVFRHGTGKNAHVHYRDGRVATFAKSEVTAFLNELDDHEANRIHHVEIEHERTRMGDAAVVDTPGLNALDEVHEQVARGFVDEADAIVWVFSATRSGAGTEAGMLHELRRGGRQVLGVLNKIDTLDAGEVAELVAYLKQQLGGVVIDMIPVCARDALAFRISSQPAGKDPFEAVEHALEQQFLARARELKRSVTTRQLREALALAKQTVERAIDELETRAKQAAATTRIEREDPQTVLARFSDDLRGGLLTADDVLTREGLALGLLQTGKGRRKGDLDELDATYLDRCFRAAALAGLQRALARTAERDPTVAEVLHHTYVPWAHGSLSALSELGFIKHTFEQHGKRIVDGEAAVKMAFRTALEPIATAWVEHARSLVDAVEHARQQAWRREASAPRAEALRLRTTILAAIDGLVQAAEGLEP